MVLQEQAVDRRVAPPRVVAAATLVFVNAAGAAVVGAALLPAATLGHLTIAAGVLLIALGALAMWSGLGLLRLDPTAHTTAQALAFVGAACSVVALVRGEYPAVLGLGLNVAILILLAGPRVRRSFT